MPQLCGQLTRWLDAELAAGHLANDDGSPAWLTAAEAGRRLGEAAVLADRLGDELAALQSAISGLNARGGAR